ncbi:MAG: glucose 1-dehydrogenase [Candidatus Omnitrophica bacterium]|nr:glucose 1-dehydrogenase [Candidatus Omnitrophota bacterium]
MEGPFSLEGEIALITGGGTGIGLGMARCMAQAGAQVILAGRRENVLQEAVQSIGSLAAYEIFDVTQLDEASRMLNRIQDRIGSPTILINNAGNHLKKSALETTSEEFLQILNTHVNGSFALTRAVAPIMIERGRGSILFIASMTSLFGLPQTVAYSAAKSAYVGLVGTLAAELSPHGVRVNAIAPGFIITEISRNAFDNDPERLERVLRRTPMNRRGDPEDIGYAAVYLCSQAAKYITGVILPIDGGSSIQMY